MSPSHQPLAVHGDQASQERVFEFAIKQGAESPLANDGKRRSASHVEKPD